MTTVGRVQHLGVYDPASCPGCRTIAAALELVLSSLDTPAIVGHGAS